MTSRNPNLRTCPLSRPNLLNFLTTTQHVSALTFGGFLIIHLSAPSVSVIAPPGSAKEWGSKAMILGRVAYQTVLTEPILVYGSAAVHVLSSLAKRAVLLLWPVQRKSISSSTTDEEDEQDQTTTIGGRQVGLPKKSWSLPTPQTLSGLILLPFLTQHVFLNRLTPSRSDAPISSLSPSELSYDYVAHGLVAYPLLSALGFGGLLAASAYHTAKGTDIIARRMRVKKMARRASQGKVGEELSNNDEKIKRRKRKGASALVVALGGSAWFAIALIRIGAEHADQGGGISSTATRHEKALRAVGGWMYKRYEASYHLVWPYNQSWAR